MIWDASVVRVSAIKWKRQLRNGNFWLKTADHRAIVKQADIQIEEDNEPDPDVEANSDDDAASDDSNVFAGSDNDTTDEEEPNENDDSDDDSVRGEVM